MILVKALGFVWLFLAVACQKTTYTGGDGNGADDSTASLALGQAPQEDAQMDAMTGLAAWASYVSYTSTALADGRRCNVGILADEDGMQQRPAVEIFDRNDAMLWRGAIALPVDTYQARATHCLASGSDLFVLVQADTQSVQSLSQTALEVVRLNSVSGKIVSIQSVVVPDVQDAYSAWVEKGAFNFALTTDGSLQISGHYKLMEAPEQIAPFIARIDLDVNFQRRWE